MKSDFLGLVQSVIATGEAALGNLNVLSGRLERDGVKGRETAERSLRILEVLAQKTRGNLDAEEAQALTEGIHSLKLGLQTPS